MISNAKRFMAYEIVKRLKEAGQVDILRNLSESCSEKERDKGQKHRVFESSFDAKAIFTEQFLYQKLNYIHHNPVLVNGIYAMILRKKNIVAPCWCELHSSYLIYSSVLESYY